ncbi:MAG TPA: hypothetical protein VNJ50_10250 [Gelidibacter sp.]|nr:hypothetical protein [Gelidibacter sp.]HXJ99219.1 hypothetical protein [Gelidibacter sp.]
MAVPIWRDYNEQYKDKLGETIKGGYISFQSESHPVAFRNIELLKPER